MRKIIVFLIALTAMFLHMNKAQSQTKPIEFKHLGAAGWIITYDTLVILLDPYISRVKLGPEAIDANDTRRLFNRTDVYVSDTIVIDQLIQKAHFIFVHHSHFDHLSDVPYIAKKTKAKVIGTETTCNILRAYGINDDQLYEVKGGEDYLFKELSSRVIPSIHSPLRFKHYFDSRVYKEVPNGPLTVADFIEGGSFMYLIRVGGKEILTMGGMNFIEREVTGLKPDVLLAGVNFSRNEIFKYTERLLTATNFPKIVIPTHWDNYRTPYGFSQKKSVEDKLVPFLEEVKAASSSTKVIFPEHLVPIVIE